MNKAVLLHTSQNSALQYQHVNGIFMNYDQKLQALLFSGANEYTNKIEYILSTC